MYPRWRGDGKELFFLSPDGTMMAAGFDATNGVSQVTLGLEKNSITCAKIWARSMSADGWGVISRRSSTGSTTSPVWPAITMRAVPMARQSGLATTSSSGSPAKTAAAASAWRRPSTVRSSPSGQSWPR